MGSYIRVGETWTCMRRTCGDILYAGIEAYCHSDGTIECMKCHPRPVMSARPKVLDVTSVECVACGTRFQTPNADATACSAKCKRRLKRKNERSSEARHRERG